MKIDRLKFRKFIRNWKMVRDITFKNCCFKTEVYKTVCYDMNNYGGALPGNSGRLINCWYHTIFTYEV